MKKWLVSDAAALALALSAGGGHRPRSSRPAGSMSARSATSAIPISTTRAVWRSRRSSATRSRRSSSRTSPKARMPSAPSSAWRATAARSSSPPRSASWTRRSRSPKKFPDVKFEHATGFKTRRQRDDLQRRFYEGRYVIGQIAAKMSKTGVAGYIVSFPIPEVVMGINAFMLGAQSVNPDFKVKIVWVNSWYRSGQGSRCRQGAVRPGRRHHRPAHRLDRAAADRRGAGQARLRPVVRHDQVRAQGAAHRDRRQLGSVLRRAGQGRARRHLEVAATPGTAWRRARSRWRPSPTCPTTSRRWRRRRRSQDQGRRAPSLHRPDHQAGRHAWSARRASRWPTATLLGMNWYVKGIDDKLPQ